MNETKIKKHIEKLKISPIFNFSLGSKEHFHSDFLVWMFNNYKKESGKVFSVFIKNKSGDVRINNAKRESRNRDIVVDFNNGQKLIIENKVKSIPYKEQLESYSSSPASNESFLLLSLAPTFFAKGGVIKTSKARWKVLSYSGLVKLIKEINSSIKNEYYKEIINDYIQVITSLSSIFSEVSVKKNDPFTFFDDSKDDTLRELKEIRMNDIYLKLKFQALARIIYEDLKEEILKMGGRIYWKEKEKETDAIYVGQDMTRGMGIANIVYVFSKNKKLLFQIQGNIYKHIFINSKSLNKNEEISKKLIAKNLWMDFSHVPDYLGVRPRNNKEFNKYKNHPWRGVDFDSEFKVRKIVKIIVNDVKKAIKNKNRIETIINEK